MTLSLDLPTLVLTLNTPLDTVRITNRTDASSKAMSIEDFEKLLKLGIRANVGELP